MGYPLLIILILAVGTVSSTYLAYSLLRPRLKSKALIKLILKGYLILALLSGAGYGLVKFIQSEPAYFEQGIEQLHTSKYIKDRIDGFSSYSFNEYKLTKDPESPAVFQVEILGDSLNLYLTCSMAKVKDRWYLARIKEDSVRKSH
jgi:hypothetical protein